MTRAQEDSTDCGFPAMPMYAKPTPGRFMLEDMRAHYPNGTKIQFHCESAYHIMSSQLTARTCKAGKWTGGTGSCAVNYGRSVELTGVTVTEWPTNTLIRSWERPARNETNQTDSEYVSYYDNNAFGGFRRRECVSFNVTERQNWALMLNDSVAIASFYITLSPGGIYNGYTSYGVAKNLTSKPIVASVGNVQCTITKIYDYVKYLTYLYFDCDSANQLVDRIVFQVEPKQFDTKYDPHNVSLCSLTIFRGPESCGTPDRPLNSYVNLVNQVAHYTCEDGYELIGSNSVMCLPTGKWSADFPQCKLKMEFCSPAPPAPGILLSYQNTGRERQILLGTVVTAQCSQLLPFKGRPLLVGARQRVCQSDGHWSGTHPFCVDSDKYQPTPSLSVGMSTKSLAIISGVFVMAVLVCLLITLVICCHLTHKCRTCLAELTSKKNTTGGAERRNTRPESRVDISEINATIEQLANFKPAQVHNDKDSEVGDDNDPDNNSLSVPDVVYGKDHSDC